MRSRCVEYGAHLDHGELRRRCHHWTEVDLRVTKREIAAAVGRVGANQGEITLDRLLQNVLATIEAAHLLAACELGAERIRAGGAGIPAFYTPVGFGTELARGKEVRCFDGREHVLEQAIKGDLALVRADTADRCGNLTFRYAQINFGPVMATAAKLAVVEVRTVLDAP